MVLVLLTGATRLLRVVTPTFVTNETLPCFANASIKALLPAKPDNEPLFICSEVYAPDTEEPFSMCVAPVNADTVLDKTAIFIELASVVAKLFLGFATKFNPDAEFIAAAKFNPNAESFEIETCKTLTSIVTNWDRRLF